MADDKPVKGIHLVFSAAAEAAEKLGPAVPIEGGGSGAGPDLRPIGYSDDDAAYQLSERLGDDWRATPDGKWWHWNGKVWEADRLMRVLEEARQVCRALASTAEAPRLARMVSSKSVIYAAVKIAATSPRHAIASEEFDRNDWLLNTPAGIVDLRTGRMRSHDKRELMTRITPVSPDGDCPQFYAMLRSATARADGPDTETIAYLQRVGGYITTGSIEEHAAFFIFGPGGSGKSLFLNALSDALGPYAAHAAMDLLTVKTGERHTAPLAVLENARLVTVNETEEGRAWDQQLFTAITGGGRITANRMRQDPHSFVPKLKLLMAGNYRPAMRNADDAMKRRMNMIGFLNKPALVDKKLPDKLRAELPGILKWMIEGAVAWVEQGLKPSRAVVEATAEYFEQENVIGRWVKDRCTTERDLTSTTASLYKDFKDWAARVGEYVPKERVFAQRLQKEGFERWRQPGTGRMGWKGVALLVGQDELPLDAASPRRSMPGNTPHAGGVGEALKDEAEQWDRDQ